MDRPAQLKSNEQEKYHPLILRRTYHGVLSMVVEKVSSIEKCKFLHKLLETFSRILACHKCNGILKENSLAFLCGHKFCEDCSYQAKSCLMCQNEGNGSGSPIRNFSEILDIINNMKANFNSENAVREMITFLLTPSEFRTKMKDNRQLPANGAFITPTIVQHIDSKAFKKFVSAGKRFKKSSSNEDSIKRKLQFVKQDRCDIPPQNSLENDSESLFLESQKDSKMMDSNKYISYLECEPTVTDPSSSYSKLVSYSRKSVKRKCEIRESLNGASNEFVMNKKLRTRSASKKNKIRIIGDLLKNQEKSESSDSSVSSERSIKFRKRSLRRPINKPKIKNVDNDVGTFLGFNETQVTASFNLLKTTFENYENENRAIDNIPCKVKENVVPINRRVSGDGLSAEKQQHLNDEPVVIDANATMKTFGILLDKTEVNTTATRNSLSRKAFINEKDKNTAPASENFKNETMSQLSGCEVVKVSCNESHSERLNIEKETSRSIQKSETDVKKEKQNLVLSLPDTETEEVVDVNVWEKNEIVNKKKKSLFKSVKERNRKSLFNSSSTSLFSSPVLGEESNNCRGEQLRNKKIIEDVVRNKMVSVNEDATESEKIPQVKETLVVKDQITMVDNTIEGNILKDGCSQNITASAKIDESNLENSQKIDFVRPLEVLSSTTKEFDSQRQTVKIVLTRIEENKCPEKFTLYDGGQEDLVHEETPAKVSSDVAIPPFPPGKMEFTSDVIFEAALQEHATKNVNAGKDESIVDFPRVALQEKVSSGHVYVDDKNAAYELINPAENNFTAINNSGSQTIPQISDSIEIVEKSIKECCESSEEQYVPDSIEMEENENVRKSNKEEIKLKCARLRKVINDQSEKLLVNMKKNFSVASPKSLMIEKSKSPASEAIRSIMKNSPSTPDSCPENVNKYSPELISDNFNKSPKMEFDKNMESLNENILDNTHELFAGKSRSAEVLTQPASPFMKSVSCQTTPDLHVALLLQEFPHLFKKTDLPLSVYDTPVDSTGNRKYFSCLKTPQVTLHEPNHPKYTVVSSVTTSEKKYEKEFTERSVLGTSLYSSFGVDKTVTELEENISCAPLRPSTEKKSQQLSSGTNDKPKLCVRLNFESNDPGDVKDCAVLERFDVISSSTPLSSIRNNKKSPDNHLTYCPGLLTVPRTPSLPNCDEEDDSSKNKSNDSNEIDFVESVGEKEMFSDTINRKVDVSGEKISSNVPGMLSDSDIIPDSCSVGENVEIRHIVKADRKIEALVNIERATTPANECKDANDDDDDDIDFVAGTPTSYAKRCVDDSLEKFVTQPNCETITTEPSGVQLLDKSDQMIFSGVNSKSQHSQSLLTHFYPLSQSNKNIESKTVENVTSSAPNADKCSADLFGSIAGRTNSKLYLTTSGLKEVDVEVVKSFCQMFSAILLDKITKDTTHVIVKIDQKNRTCRTFKYLQAIVNCVSIISVKWLQDCLQANEILKEESYLPLDSSGECGPLRAYSVKNGLTTSPLSWLRDYCIFISEPIPKACTLSQLQELLTKTGAIVIYDLRDFKKYPRYHHIVIVSDEEDSTQTSNSEIANWIQMYRAVTIEFNWLVEVIGRNRLVPFAEYELVEIPQDFLLQLNFPIEMLQDEQGINGRKGQFYKTMAVQCIVNILLIFTIIFLCNIHLSRK